MMHIIRNRLFLLSVVLFTLIGIGISILPGQYDTNDPDFPWSHLMLEGIGLLFNIFLIAFLIIHKAANKPSEKLSGNKIHPSFLSNSKHAKLWIWLIAAPNIFFLINIIGPIIFRRKTWYWQQGYEGWRTYSVELAIYLISICCAVIARMVWSNSSKLNV